MPETWEEMLARFKEQAANGKRWCYDCGNYYTCHFLGYTECHCRIHGSLDCDQTKRHPDTTADTCPDYKQKDGPRWFEKE